MHSKMVWFFECFFNEFLKVFGVFFRGILRWKKHEKSLKNERCFHRFFYVFGEVLHSETKSCDPWSIRKFSSISWGAAFSPSVKICHKRVRTWSKNHCEIYTKIDRKIDEKVSQFFKWFLSVFWNVQGCILAAESYQNQ